MTLNEVIFQAIETVIGLHRDTAERIARTNPERAAEYRRELDGVVSLLASPDGRETFVPALNELSERMAATLLGQPQ